MFGGYQVELERCVYSDIGILGENQAAINFLSLKTVITGE